ncbi:MAG: alkaline phosphatase, partial [Bacteroidetes bacterium]|nr:alkaline phosphatase [Bacteroidota bacterium]
MQQRVLSMSRALSVIVILCSTTAMSQRSNSGLQDHSVPGIGVSSLSPYITASHPLDIPTAFRNTAKDTPSPTSIGSVFVVTTINDTGNGSLRKAISDANVSPGADTIRFNISPAGAKTITPLSKLPNIIDPVTIDGTTQPGFVDKPMIELNC